MATAPRTLVLTEPAQLKALSHPLRTKILDLLEDEPRSAKALADALGVTHGKAGHHVGVLARTGLIEVVEERAARGFTERIHAPTYDRLEVRVPGTEHDRLQFLLAQAGREAAPTDEQPFEPFGRIYSVRIPTDRAAQFAERLVALAEEFAEAAEPDGERFGFVGAVYKVVGPGSTA
jgi:DNA-binding transcriptional ArsR family regulator